MKTFTKAKEFVFDPRYQEKRREALFELEIQIESGLVDAPLIGVLNGYATLPHCFSLQSCYGHFIHNHQKELRNIEPLPNYLDKSPKVEYRLAYIALCLQNNDLGKKLLSDLKKVTEIDPNYIQFGSADWFWKSYLNSFVLQIEPEKSKTEDRINISMEEALHIEKLRNRMFEELERILQKHQQLVRKQD